MLFVDLQNVYAALNEGLFSGILPMAEFDGPHDHRVVFQFLRPYVIGVGRNFALANRTSIFDHLLHQMIHAYNVKFHHVKEWRSPEYHATYFKPEALSCGLNLVRHAKNGWSIATSMAVCPCPAGPCDHVGKMDNDCPARRAPMNAVKMRRAVYQSIGFSHENLFSLQQQLQNNLRLFERLGVPALA